MSDDPGQIAAELAGQLERAWNAADGAAYGAAFTDDADFVAIRGDYHRTRQAIARGHQAILDSIYRGSQVRFEVTRARRLADDVILAHATQTMNAPTGPLAGTGQATATMVLVRRPEGWRIAAYHNTLVQGQPGASGQSSRP
ncbi:MAG TPA: SgcJ/EcaC family oxidoreductase [Longimicrobium sp.]|nr:SgcJ/EcaC family oxidoreductase [Longimicrobium sp.]